MVMCMKESSIKEFGMGKGNWRNTDNLSTKGTLKKGNFMVKERCYIIVNLNIQGNSNTAKNTVKVFYKMELDMWSKKGPGSIINFINDL